MTTNPRDPAFSQNCEKVGCPWTGLTKREYFAGQVMQGLAADGSYDPPNIEAIAKNAIEWADALISELNKDMKQNSSYPKEEQ